MGEAAESLGITRGRLYYVLENFMKQGRKPEILPDYGVEQEWDPAYEDNFGKHKEIDQTIGACPCKWGVYEEDRKPGNKLIMSTLI